LIVECIVRDFQPLQIVLFGSNARGEATADGDVDVLVVMSEVNDKRRTTVEIRRSLADLPVCKDIVVTTLEEIAPRGPTVTYHIGSCSGFCERLPSYPVDRLLLLSFSFRLVKSLDEVKQPSLKKVGHKWPFRNYLSQSPVLNRLWPISFSDIGIWQQIKQTATKNLGQFHKML
jgi:uncharacterized protein